MQIKKTFCSILMASALISFLGLGACDRYGHVAEVDDTIQLVLDEAQTYIEQAKIPYTPESTDTVTTKEDIWLGQNSFKMNGGEPLPKEFEEPDALTVSFNEPITLADLVSELRDMTGLRFSVEELRASNELPEEALQINYTGSLSGLLDYLSHKYGVWWRNIRGNIDFYKLETRVFTIYALPVESSMSASLSGTPTESSGGSSTTLSMNTNVTLTLWQNIESGIRQVMGSNGGEMLVNSTAGTVTVTAEPYIIQKVARYVQDLNEKMSRQVAISVKVLQVTLENKDQYGLNLKNIDFHGGWHIVGGEKVARFAANFAGPFADADSGFLSMALVDGKKWDTNSIIQALSTQGKTSLVTSTSVTTLNNKVAPVQVTTQENYVKETTIEKDYGSSDNGSTSVEMDTDTLNYGFTMEILPRILDNGRLIILFSMTLTDLISLTTFSSNGQSGDDPSSSSSNSSTSGGTSGGEGEGGSSSDSSSSSSSSNDGGSDETTVVQLPKMETRGFVQEIAMRSGSTLVLTGFEKVQNIVDFAGVGQPRISILGGKSYATQIRSVLVILLTPEILVSPLSPETRMENF